MRCWCAGSPKRLNWVGFNRSPIPILADGAISREIAEQSMALLKNADQILPFNLPIGGTKAPKAALLGPMQHIRYPAANRLR